MSVATSIALIFGIILSLVGAGQLLKGPSWEEKEDEMETISRVVKQGESFTHTIYLPRLDRALVNLQTDSVADIEVNHVYIAKERVLWLQGHRGPFEFRHVYPEYSTTFEISITNPSRLGQGSVSYTLRVSEYREIPSGYESGSGFLLIGVLVATVAAFKPGSIRKTTDLFIKTKLLETMIRMSSICFSFLGLIIIELKLMATVPFMAFSLSGIADFGNASFVLFSILILLIFPLAVISYFVSPIRIERQWKLRKALDDPSVQHICDDLSRRIGLKQPPRLRVINHGATCFIFGNGLSRYKLVISSQLRETLSEEEIKSIISHELSHTLHRDMIFMTWGDAYLNYAKYWLAAVIGITILLIALHLFQDISYLLLLCILSVLGFLYSFYLINSISRDREYLSDLRAINLVDKSHLRSALIKVKKEALSASLISGSRLLFYSPLEGKVPSMFSTHPGLTSRLNVINGEWLPDLLSAGNVIHVALIAGFSMPFFLNILQIPSLNAGDGAGIFLSIFFTGIIVGIVYGLYFAYRKIRDSQYQTTSLKRKFFMVLFSSLISIYLGNTLAILIFYLLALNFNVQQFIAVMLGGVFVFIVAFPVSLLFQYIFKDFLR